ncbi:MAG: hypothetical protein AAGF11_32585 [Myxococcota bacterium]
MVNDDEYIAGLVAHRTIDQYAEHEVQREDPPRRSMATDDEQRLDALMSLYDTGGASDTRPSTPETRWWGRWALGLAAAALLTLVLRAALGDRPPLKVHYEITLHRELALHRSTDGSTERKTFRSDRTIEAWLRPTNPLDTSLEVALYARQKARIRRLLVDPMFEDNGVIHIVATIEDTGLTVGEWELVFVVGRPGTLPTDIDELPGSVDGDASPYDLKRIPVQVVAATGAADSL